MDNNGNETTEPRVGRFCAFVNKQASVSSMSTSDIEAKLCAACWVSPVDYKGICGGDEHDDTPKPMPVTWETARN